MTHTCRSGNIGKLDTKACIGERIVNGILLRCLDVLAVRGFFLADAGGKTAYGGRIFLVQIDLCLVNGNLFRDPQRIYTDSAFRMP